MKFMKKILPIVLLFTIGSISPRVISTRATKSVAQPKPIPTQVTPKPAAIPQPISQPKTYAQALNIIKTQMSSDNVLRNNSFTDEFVDFITSLNLSNIEMRALLEAGVNIHMVWTDNNTINKQILLSLKNQIQSIIPSEPSAPIARSSSIETRNQTHRELLGKVKKLEGDFEIYVGAGTSAAGEQIFFAMEKLDSKNVKVWKKYTDGLLHSYYTQVIKRLRILNNKCDDKAFLETLKNDLYTLRLTEQMCTNKKKFSSLFSEDSGIGGGITGFAQMLYRQSNDNNTIYVAYASSQPITGPFKPKKEIDVFSPFTLEDFDIAYSDIIISVCVDMMPKLNPPISTEHRGIFKNPFNEIRGTYKHIAMKLHGWAGTVEKQVFHKKYMIVFPTEHAAKLLHQAMIQDNSKGMYLGTDKEPFPYERYYEKDEEQQLIKEKFPPIKQELIGNAPTKSLEGIEDLHVFELNALSKYYTDK